MKVLIKNLAIFFLFPSKQFLLGNSKFSCCTLLPKNRRNEDKSSKLGADKLVTTQIWKFKNFDLSFSDVVTLHVHLNYLPSSNTVHILPSSSINKERCKYKLTTFLPVERQLRLKQEWQKSLAGTRQTGRKHLVLFGEIERKLFKLSKLTFTYRSFSLIIFLWFRCIPREIRNQTLEIRNQNMRNFNQRW